MSPIQIALLLLAVAGVWAIAELALTLRKTRNVVDSLDKTVNDLNNTMLMSSARGMRSRLMQTKHSTPMMALSMSLRRRLPRWSRCLSRARRQLMPLPPIS